MTDAIPTMPETADGYLITREEFASWIVREDERLLVLNKPALVVVHPSKNGPWSSVVGAAREYTGLERVHLIFRLDRETSGVVVLAKERTLASALQVAVEKRRNAKRYLVVLQGELPVGEHVVDAPIGPDLGSVVFTKRRAGPAPEAQEARTIFRTLAHGGGFSVVEAVPLTGRTHQIRAHAEWLGHRVVGDKVYGGSPSCFLEFMESGWTASLEKRLLLRRQALHCLRVEFQLADGSLVCEAPPTPDLVAFVRDHMALDLTRVLAAAHDGT